MNLCESCEKTQCHVTPMQDCSVYKPKDNSMKCAESCSRYNHFCTKQRCYGYLPKEKNTEEQINKFRNQHGKEKPMVNKVIFESEEEARQMLNIILSNCTGHNRNSYLTVLKQKGYIRKSPVEEAEEMYQTIKSECIDKNDMIELTEKLYEAIQYLKAENERLRK